jgi:hypothetical protein
MTVPTNDSRPRPLYAGSSATRRPADKGGDDELSSRSSTGASGRRLLRGAERATSSALEPTARQQPSSTFVSTSHPTPRYHGQGIRADVSSVTLVEQACLDRQSGSRLTPCHLAAATRICRPLQLSATRLPATRAGRLQVVPLMYVRPRTVSWASRELIYTSTWVLGAGLLGCPSSSSSPSLGRSLSTISGHVASSRLPGGFGLARLSHA